jgi:hypothetical protein
VQVAGDVLFRRRRDRAEELLRVKVVAPTGLARAAVPSMLENGSGTSTTSSKRPWQRSSWAM